MGWDGMGWDEMPPRGKRELFRCVTCENAHSPLLPFLGISLWSVNETEDEDTRSVDWRYMEYRLELPLFGCLQVAQVPSCPKLMGRYLLEDISTQSRAEQRRQQKKKVWTNGNIHIYTQIDNQEC